MTDMLEATREVPSTLRPQKGRDAGERAPSWGGGCGNADRRAGTRVLTVNGFEVSTVESNSRSPVTASPRSTYESLRLATFTI